MKREKVYTVTLKQSSVTLLRNSLRALELKMQKKAADAKRFDDRHLGQLTLEVALKTLEQIETMRETLNDATNATEVA